MINQRLFFSIILLVVISTYSYAQIEVDCSLYIEFKTGKTICFEELKLNAFDKLVGDGEKYTTLSVRSFKLNDGRYIVESSGLGSGIYKEVSKGPKISTYSQTVNYGGTQFDPTTGAVYSNSGSARHLYYKAGYRSLRKINVENLKMTLRDDPESMVFVKKASGLSAVQAGFYVTGAAIIIAGLVQTAKSSDENPNNASLSPLVFVGAGFCFVPLILKDAKQKKLQEAIDVYNR